MELWNLGTCCWWASFSLSQCYSGPSSVPRLLSPPFPPWKWTIAANFLSRVTFRDTPRSILLKLGNWKASQFLLHQDFIISFEVKFQIHQTSLRSNGGMKMHVKIKWKRVLVVSYFVSCLSLLAYLAFINEEITSTHPRADNHTLPQNPREKKYSKTFKVLFQSLIFAIFTLETFLLFCYFYHPNKNTAYFN